MTKNTKGFKKGYELPREGESLAKDGAYDRRYLILSVVEEEGEWNEPNFFGGWVKHKYIAKVRVMYLGYFNLDGRVRLSTRPTITEHPVTRLHEYDRKGKPTGRIKYHIPTFFRLKEHIFEQNDACLLVNKFAQFIEKESNNG